MVDKNDAPKGYIAVKSNDSCSGCVLDNCVDSCGACMPWDRRDKEDVIFVKKPEMELSVADYKRMKLIAEKGISDIVTTFELATHADVKGIKLGEFDCEEGQHVKLEAEFWK